MLIKNITEYTHFMYQSFCHDITILHGIMMSDCTAEATTTYIPQYCKVQHICNIEPYKLISQYTNNDGDGDVDDGGYSGDADDDDDDNEDDDDDNDDDDNVDDEDDDDIVDDDDDDD